MLMSDDPDQSVFPSLESHRTHSPCVYCQGLNALFYQLTAPNAHFLIKTVVVALQGTWGVVKAP
jgi:hypothetical protein